MDDESLRNALADQMASGFLLELLLVDKLDSIPDELRDHWLELVRTTGRRTDQFAGLARSEEQAELVADITVRSHAALDGYLERAMARLEAGRKVRA